MDSTGQYRRIHLKTDAVAPVTGIAVDKHGCVYIVHKNQTFAQVFCRPTTLVLKGVEFKKQSGSDRDMPNPSIKFGTDEKLCLYTHTVNWILVFLSLIQNLLSLNPYPASSSFHAM